MSIHRCVFCREEFEVLYPELWAYRLPGSNSFFCSWRCLRADEKRGRDKKMSGMKKMITPEMEKKAVQIAIDGGDPRPYLRDECGSRNPVAMWGHIRAKVRDQDPETFLKLPGSLKSARTEAKAEPKAEPKEAKSEPADAGKLPKITKPVSYAGLEVSAVRDPNLGEFYRDHDHNCVDWRTGMGEEVRLSVEGWKIMAERLAKILQVLGVSA